MSVTVARRPVGLEEMAVAQGKLFDPSAVMASIQAYKPRPSDVVITPFGKCGTTWLQQTFHTLRTRGDMDFDDISRVVPWIETAVGLGLDIEAPQRAEPRGFKSHMSWDHVPKGARYIVSLRDPRDALVSNYRFFEGWFFAPGTVTIEDFAFQRWIGPAPSPRDYWSHLIGWYGQKDNPAVLVLSYEGMTRDPQASIRRVAAFCGIPLDDELLALTLERTSLDYMLQHKDRFDDAMLRALSETAAGLPPGSDSAKVRKGGVGGYKAELSPQIIATLDARWAEVVTPALGFADYAALEATLAA